MKLVSKADGKEFYKAWVNSRDRKWRETEIEAKSIIPLLGAHSRYPRGTQHWLPWATVGL